MGNFEKLVVLVILLASAGALAVSLNDSEADSPEVLAAPAGEDSGAAARGKTSGVATKSTAAEKLQRGATSAGTKRGLPLLDAAEVPVKRATRGGQKAAGYAETNSAGMPRILRSSRGLESSAVEEYKVYEPRANDTWSGLAERFYKDARHAQSLRIANEGLEQLASADFILVPVYDLAAEAGARASLRPAARTQSSPSRQPSRAATQPVGRRVPVTTAATQASARGTAPDGGVEYVVVAGDTLSEISQKVYGTARRWREIYEANKETMKSEHHLKLDMKLYIPRAGEVTVPAQKASVAEVTAQPAAKTAVKTGESRPSGKVR